MWIEILPELLRLHTGKPYRGDTAMTKVLGVAEGCRQLGLWTEREDVGTNHNLCVPELSFSSHQALEALATPIDPHKD